MFHTMNTSPLLALLFVTVLVMGVVHHLALTFFLYWQFSWFDIPMHILGGIVIAFTILVIPRFQNTLPERYFSLFAVLCGVLIIGLLWEIFEIWAGIPLYEEGFGIDLVSDLVMDIIGGVVGYYIGNSLNKLS